MTSAKGVSKVEYLPTVTSANVRKTWERKSENEISFAHATGRLRALANVRLSRENLLLFADKKVPSKRLHELLDHAAYPSANTLEERLDLKQQQDMTLLRYVCNRNTLPQVMALTADFHNLKWLLKNLLLCQAEQNKNSDNSPAAILQEQTVPARLADNLLNYGNYKVAGLWHDLLKLVNKSSNCRELSPYIAAELLHALQSYYVNQDIGSVAAAIDRLYYNSVYSLAMQAESESERTFELDYLALQADKVNMQAFLRALQIKLPLDYVEKSLVNGGEVTVQTLLQIYEKLSVNAKTGDLDMTAVMKALRPVYSKTQSAELLETISTWNDAETRFKFSKKADELLLRLAIKGRQNTYGCDAVAGQYLENCLEIKNIHLMLALRTGEHSGDKCLELLRKAD